MFERLTARGAELAQRAARRRRSVLAEALREEAPAGVRIEEEAQGVALSGRGLGRRLALEPALRWLIPGQARDERRGR
jgi:hypothetical protein